MINVRLKTMSKKNQSFHNTCFTANPFPLLYCTVILLMGVTMMRRFIDYDHN